MTEPTGSAPSRIPRLRPADMDADQREVYRLMTAGPRGSTVVADDDSLKGPFNAFLLSPAVGRALQSVGAALRYESSLPERTRELATLAVAAHAHSAYEWRSHERLGRRAGLTDSELEALRDGRVPELSDPDERAAIALVLQLLDGDVDDDGWHSASSALGNAAVFELATLVGYYATLALQLRLFRVE